MHCRLIMFAHFHCIAMGWFESVVELHISGIIACYLPKKLSCFVTSILTCTFFMLFVMLFDKVQFFGPSVWRALLSVSWAWSQCQWRVDWAWLVIKGWGLVTKEARKVRVWVEGIAVGVVLNFGVVAMVSGANSVVSKVRWFCMISKHKVMEWIQYHHLWLQSHMKCADRVCPHTLWMQPSRPVCQVSWGSCGGWRVVISILSAMLESNCW